MTPYTVAVPDDVLDDLRFRLLRTRWPAEVPDLFATDLRDFLAGL
ncbi:MAG TPA: hypothetical protein VI357_12430 [Mycobacteriales bacterium]